MGRITSSRSQLRPDPKFDSLLASKFINCLMWDGKKSIAQGVFYRALDEMKKRVQQSLAIRWILNAVRDKKGRPTHMRLADELVAAYNREGVAMTKRENTHKMADANKAFAHFA